MLVGREAERRELEAALALARAGRSATLVLLGEPGIGKTSLLDHAATSARGMNVLRARGVESEAKVPFASLLELLRPALGALGEIPQPQAVALEGAFALRPARAQDRFAIGAATLSLLAAHAEQGPLLAIVDDAHWLDDSSAQALLFALRRLEADPIAVLIAVREGLPSLADGADLPTLPLAGLSPPEAGALLAGVAPDTALRLHEATAGNPLALLELSAEAREDRYAPDGAPLLVSARISRAFLRRFGRLDGEVHRALLLAATSHSGEIALLARAAAQLDVDLTHLERAEHSGLVTLREGQLEFRHPLVRSAIYADAPAASRRDAHRALAAALPDRDLDRRAWHLAAAAAGVDATASAALERAAISARDRSAYAGAATAFERAGRLAPDREGRARLLRSASEASWEAGLDERAVALLDEARVSTADAATELDIDELAGHIATRRGPVMRGHEILVSAAERAAPERAVAMLAEAAVACFYAGSPVEMLAAAEQARRRLPRDAAPRTRFLAEVALGMARIVGGDGAAGAQRIERAVRLAQERPELREDPELLPWLPIAPIFLRETSAGRELIEAALAAARSRGALGALPFVLNLIALDHATTQRWQLAEATYVEAIGLARESGQRTSLAFGLSGLARLQARRGREAECRASAAEALALCEAIGTQLNEVWALEAIGMLELGLGEAARALESFLREQELLDELGITDPDLSPAPELVEAMLRLGREDRARRLAAEHALAAASKRTPWASARALRCEALVAGLDGFEALFERALEAHERTPDAFETSRTRLAYGERLRRARSRVRARAQLLAAVEEFERLGATPWAERGRAELQASGITLRKRDPETVDELTPQEVQIAMLLVSGKTTREAAAALFLSPKTIEYHLRHVYQKLGIHSREELAAELSGATRDPAPHTRAE
jgi:DNA-binding CsgD family transcriptional regulator